MLDYENLEVMVAAQVDKPLEADGTCPFKKPYFACEPLHGKVISFVLIILLLLSRSLLPLH